MCSEFWNMSAFYSSRKTWDGKIVGRRVYLNALNMNLVIFAIKLIEDTCYKFQVEWPIKSWKFWKCIFWINPSRWNECDITLERYSNSKGGKNGDKTNISIKSVRKVKHVYIFMFQEEGKLKRSELLFANK